MQKSQILLLGTLILIILISHVQAVPQANFQTQGTEWFKSDVNDLYKGTYQVQYGYSLSIYNFKDDSGTVLGNISYRIDADNIIDYDRKIYAQKSGSSVQWVFPENVTLKEDNNILSGVKSDYVYNRYIPITVHRTTNESVFSSDGYQLASFSVVFEDLNLEYENVNSRGIWGSIETTENSVANATILLDSFKTDMPIWHNPNRPKNIHQFEFASFGPLQVNRPYNFSVIINVQLKNSTGPAIEYSPRFLIALECAKFYEDSISSYKASTPSSMLPKYVHNSEGSTNVANRWSYLWDYMLGFHLKEISRTINNSEISTKSQGAQEGSSVYIQSPSETRTSAALSPSIALIGISIAGLLAGLYKKWVR